MEAGIQKETLIGARLSNAEIRWSNDSIHAASTVMELREKYLTQPEQLGGCVVLSRPPIPPTSKTS